MVGDHQKASQMNLEKIKEDLRGQTTLSRMLPFWDILCMIKGKAVTEQSNAARIF